MSISPEAANQVYREADCLHNDKDVEEALGRMAGAITEQLADTNPLVLCVMTGGIIPAARLMMRLDFPLQIDYIHATRYGKATTGGALEWIVRPRESLVSRTVLGVDDILDEGRTLAAIVGDCRGAGAKAVYSAVLVDKQHNRREGIEAADFTGLTVPDRYVFGYGMDYKGYWRNAPGIFAVKGL